MHAQRSDASFPPPPGRRRRHLFPVRIVLVIILLLGVAVTSAVTHLPPAVVTELLVASGLVSTLAGCCLPGNGHRYARRGMRHGEA